jgi:predicted DNA-binding antitoxin AbrB/MazE fold protein
MLIDAVYENGVFKPTRKIKAPKKVKLLVISEFEKDLDDVFGILKEDVDTEKLRK